MALARLERLAPMVIATALAALLVGCTSALQYAPRIDSHPAPPADAVALAEGSVEAALDTLPERVQRVLDESGVPGAAVAVVQGDELLFAQGFGVRRAGESAEVDENTVFQIASMSKPISATVVAALVGRELLD